MTSPTLQSQSVVLYFLLIVVVTLLWQRKKYDIKFLNSDLSSFDVKRSIFLSNFMEVVLCMEIFLMWARSQNKLKC